MSRYRNIYVPNNFYGGELHRGYPEQYGNGIVYFAGVPEQYGNGLGNILGSLFRRVVPFLFPAVKNIASTYIQAAARNLGEGKTLGASLKDSLKDAGKQTLSEVGNVASNVMKGNGKRRKRKSKKRTLHHGGGGGGGGGGGHKKHRPPVKSKNAYKRSKKSQAALTLQAFLKKKR